MHSEHDSNPAPTPPPSPSSLELGVRGSVKGVTRIGRRALAVAAIAAFVVVALIMIGTNKPAKTPQAAAQAAEQVAVPAPQATGHFGANVPIVASPVPAPTRKPASAGAAATSAVPAGLVLPTDPPPVKLSAGSGAPAASNVNVPNIETGASAGTGPAAATAQSAPDAAASLRERLVEQRNAAILQSDGQQRAEIAAAYEAPVTVNPGSAPVSVPIRDVSAAGAAGPPAAASPAALAQASGEPDASASPSANAFLNGPFAHAGNDADYIGSARTAPRSPYELVASSLIPAELVTGVDSEVAGLVTGQVREDVFDSKTGRYLLIPRGSRLIGVYKNDVQTGQTRVLVAWQRLIFPDTSSIDLSNQTGADTEGYGGLSGKVDNHFGAVFGAALLSTIITAGLQLSQPPQGIVAGGVTMVAPGQVAAGAVGQQIAQLGSALSQKALSIPPVIHVPKGYPFVVVVDRDLVLPGPYGSGS